MIFRAHTGFTPKFSKTSAERVYPGDYNLEPSVPQPANGGTQIIDKDKRSIYLSREEVEQYGELVNDSAFVPIECQLHTLQEVISLLRESPKGVRLSPKSSEFLADWLQELVDSRTAIYETRVALAKIRR